MSDSFDQKDENCSFTSITEWKDLHDDPDAFAVFTMDNHLRSLPDLIFEPSFSSRKVKVIGDTILTTSDKIEIDLFDSWLCKTYLKGFFKDTPIKCVSNFPYTIDGHTVTIDVNSDVGYVYLRCNTGSMKYTKYFHTSKNHFEKKYVIHKIKET